MGEFDMRILIAEDEIIIAKALKLMLEKNKYTVDMVNNGSDALDYALMLDYDLLVLDIMMPGMDGIEVLKKVRAQKIATPVLFLTAKSEIADRVAGLDAGADDYLSKPFDSSEFLARVRALLRRSENYVSSTLKLGNVQLDCGRYTLSTPNQSVRLNNKEYQLMELFMRRPGQIFSTELLMDRIWQQDAAAELDVVWTYIGFIRKKLKQIDADIEIRTIRGAGYALEETVC